MSIETGSLSVPVSDAWRPLPPAIEFNAAAARFSGTAEPGEAIRLTSSTDQSVQTVTTDADGNWQIALGETPRLYTAFDIHACDPETKACSAGIRLNYGGSNPRLSDVYASRTLAFGIGPPGSKVTIFGPKGKILGQSFVFGRHGVWAVKFCEAVVAGDRLCVLAEAFSGNTSMPLFTKAEAFSVDVRNVGRISGAGAKPSDNIQVFDVATGQEIGRAVANTAGDWTLSIEGSLEAGTRLALQRTHTDGTTTKGLVFAVQKDDCLAPVIENFSGNQLSGIAEPGLQVEYTQYRNGQIVHSGSVSVSETGFWSSSNSDDYQPLQFQTGDILVARTTKADGTAESLIPSSVTIGGTRPGAPLVMYIDQNTAWGYAGALKNVIVSTEDKGLIWVGRTGRNGYWSVDWTPAVGSLTTTTRVFFEVMDSWQLTNDVQTSTATVRYADAAAAIPEAPVITTYLSSEIGGTEATPDTVVVVHNEDADDQAINPSGATVVAGQWVVEPAASNAPKDGDEIYAVAWTLTDKGGLGVNSLHSTPVEVNDYVPPNPTVSFGHPSDIEGSEPVLTPDLAQLPNIVIHVGYESVRPRKSIADSGHLTSGRAWSITPVPALIVGDQMVAWAETDAGKKSGETPFTITAQVTAVPLPPMITRWVTADISGTGSAGTLVTLYSNGQYKGSVPVGAANTGYSWKINVGTTPAPGDVLKAVATDTVGHNSDSFYIYVGDVPTMLTVEAVTTGGLTANVTTVNQKLLAWRGSDGLKVIDHTLSGAGTFTAPYLSNVTVETGDLIYCSSMNTTHSSTEGTMVHYDTKPVPYSA